MKRIKRDEDKIECVCVRVYILPRRKTEGE